MTKKSIDKNMKQVGFGMNCDKITFYQINCFHML